MNTIYPPAIALIAGPTASGKSGLAVALANCLRDAGHEAVVINADASQVYRDIPILSATPTAAQMGDVPHRLFGHVDASESVNAARWGAEARAAIVEAAAAGAVPILVGGTGLYLKTLIEGIAPVPDIAADVRAMVRALPVAQAHRRLAKADPAAAARLAAGDTTRVQRALEVVLATGRPLAAWQQQRSGGIGESCRIVPLLLLPPREALRARCDARLLAMVDGGALGEVAALVARDLDPTLPAMRAIGVRDLAGYMAGEIDRDTAIAQAQLATRHYAKRQYTFFRGQFPTDWTRIEAELNDSIIADIVSKLRYSLLTG